MFHLMLNRKRRREDFRKHLCLQWIASLMVLVSTVTARYASEFHSVESDNSQPPDAGSGYSFAFAVRDEPTYKDHSHQETSDGHVVRGSYRVALPDGRVQVVNYRADRNGYVADVTYEGNINYAPGYSPYAASNHPAPPHFNQKPAGASSAPANEHLQEKSSNLHWRNDAEASEAPEEVKSSDMQISQLVPQVNSTEVESEVAKIFPVDEPVSTETPATVNEPVNEPRIRPIKLSLPKPSSEIVPPVPIPRIRPIKLAFTKPLQIAKSVAKPDSLVTPRIRPIKLNFPKPIDQATKSDDQTDGVQVSRSKSALPKLALKRPFPKPVVEQPSRPKATDGILKPIYPRPLFPKLGPTLDTSLPKPSYLRPSLPKTFADSTAPLSLKKTLIRKPELKLVYPKISANTNLLLRRPSNIAFPKPNLFTTTTTTTEAPTTEMVTESAVESETVIPVTESDTEMPAVELTTEELVVVTESITESPSTEAETELLITTTESPVAHESFTATRQDSLSEERLVVTTEITESMTEWSTESVPIESQDEANLSTTESSVTETTPIGEESTESAVFLYFPLQIA